MDDPKAEKLMRFALTAIRTAAHNARMNNADVLDVSLSWSRGYADGLLISALVSHSPDRVRYLAVENELRFLGWKYPERQA